MRRIVTCLVAGLSTMVVFFVIRETEAAPALRFGSQSRSLQETCPGECFAYPGSYDCRFSPKCKTCSDCTELKFTTQAIACKLDVETVITEISECESAAKQLGIAWNPVATGNYPYGCIWLRASNEIFFNTNEWGSGDIDSDHQAVCVVDSESIEANGKGEDKDKEGKVAHPSTVKSDSPKDKASTKPTKSGQHHDQQSKEHVKQKDEQEVSTDSDSKEHEHVKQKDRHEHSTDSHFKKHEHVKQKDGHDHSTGSHSKEHEHVKQKDGHDHSTVSHSEDHEHVKQKSGREKPTDSDSKEHKQAKQKEEHDHSIDSHSKEHQQVKQKDGHEQSTDAHSKASSIHGAENHDPMHGHDVYDRHGWHLVENDIVAHIIDPETLLPLSFMPVFFAFRLMCTFLIFGFSLRFHNQNEESGDSSSAASNYLRAGRVLGEVVFIGLALNGWYCDYLQVVDAFGKVTHISSRVGVVLLTWVTSSNYMASRAVWEALIIENPVHLLGLKPRYVSVPNLQVPLCPGAARWLSRSRHIYALILLPYFLPCLYFQIGIGLLFSWWSIVSKCKLICGCLTGTTNVCCAFLGTIFTIGLVAWTRNAFDYWFTLEFPLLRQMTVQVWATFVAPLLFSCIFGLLLCAPRDIVCQGIQKGFMSFGRTFSKTKLDEDDALLIGKYNADVLQDDFTNYNRILQVETNERDEQRIDLRDSKVQVFYITLSRMSSIVMEQLITIFLYRALNGRHGYENYMGALRLTLTERGLNKYIEHFKNEMQQNFALLVNQFHALL